MSKYEIHFYKIITKIKNNEPFLYSIIGMVSKGFHLMGRSQVLCALFSVKA